MKKLNVMAVTTSRADYGLLYPLIKKLNEDEYFDFELVVTGTHLSSIYGKTIDRIVQDGFTVNHIVEMTLNGDKEHDICNCIAEGVIGFSKIFQKEQFDLVILLGDRYELLSVSISAVINKVPIVHIHGGEATYGQIDDPIRHSVTKMSAIHFPSIDIYMKRIIQMGESPERVFAVGALGIDNIKNISLMKQTELEDYTGVNFDNSIALMTYHPVTLDNYSLAASQVREILEALISFDIFTIITMPNSDTGGNCIYETIKKYIQLYPDKFKLIKNLGQRAYLGAMKYSKLMIGNSSSGIIESASFKLPVVNIGDRQAGRYKPQNVIDCICSKQDIIQAVDLALSNDFQNSIAVLENPYGDGNTANRIIKILKSIDFTHKSRLIKKGFYDINFQLSEKNMED